MGLNWVPPGDNSTTSITGHLTEGISQTTKEFSAASGVEAYPNGQILPTPNLRIFTFSELKVATRNFRADTMVGEGGFGQVFRGCLNEKVTARGGTKAVIAVKSFKPESYQGFAEWQTEVNCLGRRSHPNLIKLLGYCQEDVKLLLIYEFMQNGSLEKHLFRRHGFSGAVGSAVQPLPWDIRFKIAIGVAQGLAFLHTSEEPVIHRDISASNILLDESYIAKISDFGLARMGPSVSQLNFGLETMGLSASQSYVSTRVMGTYGYAAPEYVATGHLYVKSDVYGFGVVLLEMLTGLRVYDARRPSGQHNLVEWVRPYLSGFRRLKNIMDSQLEGRYPSKAAAQTVHLALKCVEPKPGNRPSMKEVVEILGRIEAANE